MYYLLQFLRTSQSPLSSRYHTIYFVFIHTLIDWVLKYSPDLLVSYYGFFQLFSLAFSIQKNQVTDFMTSRNMEEDMAEDRHLWRLGGDGRLLAV